MKKIVIIGPESTGKSTLCEQLAKHFDTLWCPEYAREYLQENGMAYTYHDLLTIAKGQLMMEDRYANTILNNEGPIVKKQNLLPTTNNEPRTCDPPLLFIDTDMYVMKVWCEYVFGKCHQLILDNIAERKYDLYLLCNVDLPWVMDPLREYPDEGPRKELFHIYKNLLMDQQIPWATISGGFEERLQKAIDAVALNCLAL